MAEDVTVIVNDIKNQFKYIRQYANELKQLMKEKEKFNKNIDVLHSLFSKVETDIIILTKLNNGS